jgi:hypothetical protein
MNPRIKRRVAHNNTSWLLNFICTHIYKSYKCLLKMPQAQKNARLVYWSHFLDKIMLQIIIATKMPQNVRRLPRIIKTKHV